MTGEAPLRLLHLSDIHFGCENRPALDAATAWAQEGRFDLVAVTGDITQEGRLGEFETARAWLELLPAPRLCTPGNHDTPYFDLAARLAAPWARYEDFIGPRAFASAAGPGLAAVTMNTARGAQPRLNWSKGQARAADARAAGETLAGGGTALKVLVCHHPLVEVTHGPMTGRVWGGRRAARILAEAGADLILTGHVHMPFAHAMPFGDGRTYNVGASTLSLRERGSPAGFNVIEADAAQIQVRALGWTGTRFEVERSWGFERRGASRWGAPSALRDETDVGVAFERHDERQAARRRETGQGPLQAPPSRLRGEHRRHRGSRQATELPAAEQRATVELLPRGRIPQPQRPVVSARGQAPAVRRPRAGPDPALVTLQAPQLLPRGRIPQPQRPVVSA